MKFLILLVIPIFFFPHVWAQCPSSENASIEIKENGNNSEVVLKLDKEFEEIQEVNVIQFGVGIVKDAEIRKRNKREYIINALKPGEYMVQIISDNCTVLIGTDKDYRGFIIK